MAKQPPRTEIKPRQTTYGYADSDVKTAPRLPIAGRAIANVDELAALDEAIECLTTLTHRSLVGEDGLVGKWHAVELKTHVKHLKALRKKVRPNA